MYANRSVKPLTCDIWNSTYANFSFDILQREMREKIEKEEKRPHQLLAAVFFFKNSFISA